MDPSAKFGILCFVAAVAVATSYAAYHGWQLAALSHQLPTPAVWRRHATVLQTHRHATSGLLWLMGLLVVTVEFSVQKFGLSGGALFWVHVPFAALWLGAFVAMKFFYPGNRHPHTHRRLGYLGIGSSLVAGTLGTVMVLGS